MKTNGINTGDEEVIRNKDWTGNKTAAYTCAGYNTFSKNEREQHDFYATSPGAVEKLLVVEQFSNVWECACGAGHISEVLKKHGIHGKSSDLIDRGYGEVINFLTTSLKWDGDIITNPPYKHATAFVYQALNKIPDGNKVAMIFPQRYLSSKERYRLFTSNPPLVVYAFSGRCSCAMNGDFSAHAISAVDYMWIVWKKGFAGVTSLKWIL
jgi:hypothetical protein